MIDPNHPMQRILIPIDLSDASRTALEFGTRMADRLNAEVTVLHVYWEPPPYIGSEVMMLSMPNTSQSVSDYSRTKARSLMDGLIEKLPAPWSQRIIRRLEAGDAAGTIVALVEHEGYDLVIVSTHGRHGFSHFLMGSVTEKVVRTCPCPVLTVRHRDSE